MKASLERIRRLQLLLPLLLFGLGLDYTFSSGTRARSTKSYQLLSLQAFSSSSLPFSDVATSTSGGDRSSLTLPVMQGQGLGPALPTYEFALGWMPLVALAGDGLACLDSETTLVGRQPLSAKSFGVFVHRGNCSFETKYRTAEKIGASFIAIADTLEAIYESSVPGQDKYDCTKGRGFSIWNSPPSGQGGGEEELVTSSSEACTQSSQCPTGLCILTGRTRSTNSNPKQYEVCCAKTPFIQMKGSMKKDKSHLMIPGVFLSVLDGQQITKMIQKGPVYMKAFDPDNSWNISSVLIWFLGVVTAVTASYYSARRERLFSRQVVVANYMLGDKVSQESSYNAIDGASEAEHPMYLTPWHAFGFLVMGSSMLILLYYVHILVVVNVIFLICGAYSLFVVAIYPLLSSLHCQTSMEGTNFCVSISAAIALCIGLWWFYERKNPNMWILQDLFGFCICMIFVDTIHVQSLRVGSCLLWAAFVYDVFFVFISPMIFGSSVMIDVASGSGKVSYQAKDYCSLHPSAAECNTHDSMPMVLRIPLIFSYYGGEAMLGLGDIVLPSIILSFTLRYDYSKGYPISNNYFAAASIAYGIGLLIANIAAIAFRNIISGQPALMYIVPILLGSVSYTAYRRKDLHELWIGPDSMSILAQEQPLLGDY